MSPEQCRGLRDTDHRSDIYALGCVLFRMLTGRPPFDGEGPGDIIAAHIREPAPPPSRYTPGLSASVDALVLRCLAKAPAARFPTMAELAAATGQLLQQMPGDEARGASSLLPPSPMMVNLPGALAQATTLGRSSGQFEAANERERGSQKRFRAPRWVTGIAAVAVMAGLTIAAVRHGTATDVAQASNPIEPRAPVAVPMETPADAADPAPDNRAAVVRDVAGSATGEAAPATEPGAGSNQAVDAASNTVTSEVTEDEVEILKDDGSDAPPTSAVASLSSSSKGVDPLNKPAHHSHKVIASSLSSARPSSSASSSNRCAKATFAAVYNAPAPPRPTVDAAIRTLQVCHESGAFSNAEFNQYHHALMGKLLR